MKRLHLLFLFCLSVLSATVLTDCSDDELTTAQGYGYLQFRLSSLPTRSSQPGRSSLPTRSLTEGNPLEHLSDARKLKLSLKHNGRFVEQTVALNAVSAEAAEHSLFSENLTLLSGEYQLLGYALYGDYQSGDMPEILQVVTLEQPQTIHIQRDALTRHELQVEARQYGRFSAQLLRLEPMVETRAGAPVYSEIFDYDDIDSVQMVLERNVGGVTYREDHKVKAYRYKDVAYTPTLEGATPNAPFFRTDSLQLQTGSYKLTHYELFSRQRRFMYAQDVEVPFEVKHFEVSQGEVGVQLAATQATHDGILLKQIWDAMDGSSWKFHDLGNVGANWVFTLADGSPRPVSAWTHQVGVVTNSQGRVISLNLGAFNPLGEVPDAIGGLDALERLYLGEHTDEVYYTLEGVGDVRYVLSPWLLSQTTDLREHRMDIARERTLLRNMRERTDLQQVMSSLASQDLHEQLSRLRYAASVQTGSFAPANRITGISEKIGQLSHLQELYIANTLITKLPKNMSQLTQVTDLELYNNPLTELDGEVFKGMDQLASVNIDRLFNLSEEQLHAALNKMCEYCPKLQLLYLCNLKLTKLPSKLNRLTDLRLLDCSHNRIATLTSLLPMAPIQVILDHNLLTTLPADLFKTDDIESFSCTDNLLTEFPVLLSNMKGLYTFEKVNFMGNRMHGFQPGFEGIRCEQLNLADNYMGRRPGDDGKGYMPTELAKTGSVINYLDLSNNNIDTIRNAALKGLQHVQALDLSKNELRSLPSSFSSETFPWLTGLDISKNRFDEFPDNVLNVLTLQQLLISDQGYFRDASETRWVRTMTQWPTYLHVHPALTNVDMSGNDFRTVINFPANLTTLKVGGNPHIKMVIPQDVWYRMQHGLFVLYMDEGQDITLE